jgi:outer membrane protein assembly factor BamD
MMRCTVSKLLGLSATLLAVAFLAAGCTSTTKAQQADSTAFKVVDADEQVLKQDPLERNYDPHIIMKRAESFFEKEDYAEAGVEYQHFLDLHKTHVLAPYAQYRLSLSHLKQVTTRDRDPEPVRRAMEAMQKLLREYPGSRYEADAHARIKECREHLAWYEMYVGQYYYRQTAYLAALHRFDGVIKQYADSEAFPEAVYALALTYADIGASDRAIEYLTQFLQQYPKKTKATKDSRLLLAKLTRRPVDEIAAPTQANGAPAAPPMKNDNNGKTTPISALVLAADRGGEK